MGSIIRTIIRLIKKNVKNCHWSLLNCSHVIYVVIIVIFQGLFKILQVILKVCHFPRSNCFTHLPTGFRLCNLIYMVTLKQEETLTDCSVLMNGLSGTDYFSGRKLPPGTDHKGKASLLSPALLHLIFNSRQK